MEIVIQLIFIVAIAKFCLKAAMTGKLWSIICYAIFLAVIPLLLYPIVIAQPLSIISDLLGSRSVVENIALITTAESLISIFISIYLIKNYFLPKAQRGKFATAVKIIPGFIVFFAITYFELLFFKMRVGGEFIYTAAIYSAIVFIGVVSLSLLFKYLLSGESIKLELRVLLNLIILVLGLLVSSSVAEYNVSHAQSQIEWGALITIIAGSLVLIATGAIAYKYNISIGRLIMGMAKNSSNGKLQK